MLFFSGCSARLPLRRTKHAHRVALRLDLTYGRKGVDVRGWGTCEVLVSRGRGWMYPYTTPVGQSFVHVYAFDTII